LKVKGEDTFLDLTAKQILKMREDTGSKVKFMLMNSFSTTDDTIDFFKENYPILAAEEGLEMLQNKVPKLDATTYEVRFDGSICSFVLNNDDGTHFLTFPFSLSPYSLPLANPTQTTNGAHLVTATCTPPWLVPAAWILSSPLAANTCLCRTLTTSEPSWT
jgi:hypothetical protein